MPVITTNMAAMSAGMQLNRNSREQLNSLAKLSSGSRIVRASDDAAGLAVSTALQSDITTLKQAATNIQQGKAVIQTADGALARAQDILLRISALCVQYQSGSLDITSKGFLQIEHTQLRAEVSNIAIYTSFNGVNLLSGTASLFFQTGVDASDTLQAVSTGMDVSDLSLTQGVGANLSVYGQADLVFVDLEEVATYRATLGAQLSQFQTRGDIVDTSIENLASAKSSIFDVDIAAEQTNLINRQILTESSIAALAQANKMKSDLLTLVK